MVARQNGKGTLLEVRQIAGLFVLGERLQIHSAHEFKTCYEHFRRVKDLIQSCPLLEAELLPVTGVRTGAGDQAIETRSGNRLRFIARSRTSGVGFSADTVYLDEAFLLDDVTMGALMPTMSARPNSQMWYTSSAPHEDSPVLHRLRRRALDNDPRLFYVEWGNDPGVDPTDRDAWARANPALGVRISEEDVAAELRSMSPATFARERLGVPEPELNDDANRPIPIERWRQLADRDTPPPDNDTVRLAVDASPSGGAVFSVAGLRDDGLLYVGIREVLPPSRKGDLPLKDRVVERARYYCNGHRTSLILPPLPSPARGWHADLVAAGIKLDEMTGAEYTEARTRIVDAVADGALRHRDQPDLNAAVGGLMTKFSGDGESWSRRNSSSNIAPLVAATCALVRVPDKGERAPRVYSLQPKGR